MAQSVLEMAKDLVEVQIQSRQLPPAEMNAALQRIHASLMELKTQEATGTTGATETPAPVDWRKSITRNAITCLACGESYKQLSIRHLRQHDMDGQSYRAKYGIPRSQPLAARATTARRREVAKEIKPWEKTPRYQKAQAAKAKAAQKGARKKAVGGNG